MSEEPTDHDEEIGFLDLAIVLAKHKKLILGFPLAVALVAAVVSLLMTPIYTGTTRILTPQQGPSAASAMLGQFDNIIRLPVGIPGVRNPADLYVGMLKSRTVADNLIQRFDLNQLYEHKVQSDTRKTLADATDITAGRDGIIVIEVDDEDAKRAAALANGYVEELLKLTTVLAVTTASQRRLFFERQFVQTKENLVKAEMAARVALEKGGLANIDAQSRAILETTAVLRAQIAAKEVEISAMRTFATDRNPELVRGQDTLAALKSELSKIEGATQARGKGRNTVPSLGLENVRLLREVKYNEVLYELLAKQYELARIDEANDAGIVQILDKAIEPDRRSSPKRTLIVLLSALVGLIAGILWALAREAMERARSDPVQAVRLEAVRRYLTWNP